MPDAIVDTRLLVETESDIVAARKRGRELALELGFSPPMATVIATAISELARNILLYAERGEVAVSLVERGTSRGLVITATDAGQGIPDVRRAMEDGYSTGGRLGLGLPGVRRLMDEIEVVSGRGEGTTVRVTKWLA